jgi:thiamine pyrophosphate-dependent acetolactate synthase large subunit-like protein
MTTSQRAAVDRRIFVAKLMQALPDALIVTGLGSPSYDVFAAIDRDSNFYLWGAMGGAASMGLGLALAQPGKSVVVITGDGEALMGIGSLATIGAKRPLNLTIVILDNGHFGETGMQRSHTSMGTSFVAVAKGVGIEDAIAVTRVEDFAEVAKRVHARSGPALAQVFIHPDEPPRALPPRDGTYVKNRFRAHLGFKPF